MLQMLIDRIEELLRIEVVFPMFDLIAMHADSQVLCHLTAFHHFDANGFKGIGEIYERLVAIQLSAKGETPGPGKNGSDGVGGSGLTGLVVTIMAGNCAVRRFRLHDLTVGCYEDGGHESEGTKSLGDGVALHVAIVVLAGPDKIAIPLEGAGNHIIDQTVFVDDTGFLVSLFEFILIDILEDVFKSSVVFLEDGVLRRKVERPFFAERHIEAAPGKALYRLVGVIH